jgi:hypothetical protein
VIFAAGVIATLFPHLRGRPAGTFALLAVWPAALVAQLLLVIAGAAIAYLLISQSLPDTGRDLLAGTREFLVSNQILIIATSSCRGPWAGPSRYPRSSAWWPS